MSQVKEYPPVQDKPAVLSTRPDQLSQKHFSEVRLLCIIVIGIFLAEMVAMFLIYELPSLPYLYTTLIDAGVMTTLIFPVLYFLSFRPLTNHIEKRRRAEGHLRRVNRALSVLNECNRVLVRSENETELLQKMCEIIVNTGQYRMTWVGFAEHGEARSVRPVAQSGFEDNYLSLARITWADNELGHGPTGSAIRDGAVQVNQSFPKHLNVTPWRELALMRGYQSSIALPLKDDMSTFGALTIYSASPDAFDEEEVQLLSELANNLAFGITALRVRTDRDQVQEQVREMALFPALNPNPVLRVDASGTIQKTNPAANQMGFSVGVQLTAIWPDLRDLDLVACIANGSTQQIQHAAGLGERILLWTVHGVAELGFAFLYSVDITERRHAEAAVHQLSSIVEQTEDTVVVTDRAGLIEYVNPAFERLTGYTKEEVLGKTPRVVKSTVHQPEFYQNLWETILKGEVFQGEIANCKKNGDVFYEVKTITPLRDAQGNIIQFVATGKNITERKLDEEKLLRAYDELELRVEERTEQLKLANSNLEREIIERKEAEDAVRQSAVMLRAILEQMPSGVTVRDARTGELVFSNIRSLEILNGLVDTPEEFAEYRGFRPDGSVYHSEEWPVYRSMATGEVVHAEEIECERSNGTRFTILASSAPIYDREGKIVSGVSVVHDITERKQIEWRLAYLASFPERNPNPVIEVDFEGQVRYSNPSTLKAFPDLPEQGAAHPWLAGLGTVLQAFREGRISAASNDVVVGGRAYQQSYFLLIEDQLIRIYGADITERKQAEEALKESERRLNQAQEIAHLGSWELDLVNNQLTWSDEVCRIFGLQPQEFKATYEAFLEAVHPEDRTTVDDAYSRSIREGRDSYEIEHRIIKSPSGEVCIVHEKCEHFRNEVGQIIRSVGMVHDITERKQANDALRAARDELELRVQERTKELETANRELLKEINERVEIERQLRIQTAAMESAANGIVITDRLGNIQWSNPAFAQISGYDANELVGQSMRVLQSGQHLPDYYRQMWNTILSGEVWRGETTNRRKDGTLYIEEQTITPVHDENGQIPHFISIKQDVTQRKQAEEELERRNLELQVISTAEHNQRQFSEALVAAALILKSSLKLNKVLPLILDKVREVIPFQLADIALLDGESFYDACHQGDLVWTSSLTGVNNRFLLESFPLLSRIRQLGEPVLILDSRVETDWVGMESLGWVRSFLSAPLLVEKKVIGFVNLFSDLPGFFTQESTSRLVAFAAHAAVAIQNAWLFEQVQASTERLQSLSRRLVEIQENERRYISRELHDEAGQVLTSLLVDLKLLEKNISEPEVLLKIVTEMEDSLNMVIQNLHRVAMALRPASLDHVGLVAALRQHVESVGEKHGLSVTFRSSGVSERLSSNVETVLYRIVQEALTNAVRHAHASQIDVVLTVRDGRLIVIVEDDGVGFEPETLTTGDHLGLFGMRERAEMIAAELVIESAPGKGTTIMMEVGYADTVVGRR